MKIAGAKVGTIEDVTLTDNNSATTDPVVTGFGTNVCGTTTTTADGSATAPLELAGWRAFRTATTGPVTVGSDGVVTVGAPALFLPASC